MKVKLLWNLVLVAFATSALVALSQQEVQSQEPRGVSIDQVLAESKGEFSKFDTNEDGALSKKELALMSPARDIGRGDNRRMRARGGAEGAHPKGKRGERRLGGPKNAEDRAAARTEMMLERLDTDDSGSVSEEEFLVRVANLKQLDANDDGIVTRAEMRTARQARAAARSAATAEE